MVQRRAVRRRAALPLEKSDIETVLAAADLDWSEIDPSILGTLFERGLDPGKHAQLGALHGPRKILQLVEPVVIRPLLAEWEREAATAAELEHAEAARSRAARMKRRNDAQRRYRTFVTRLREFTVLDAACGSGNFLYLALPMMSPSEPILAAYAQGAASGGTDRGRRPAEAWIQEWRRLIPPPGVWWRKSAFDLARARRTSRLRPWRWLTEPVATFRIWAATGRHSPAARDRWNRSAEAAAPDHCCRPSIPTSGGPPRASKTGRWSRPAPGPARPG